MKKLTKLLLEGCRKQREHADYIQRISPALAKQDEWLRYSPRQKRYMLIDCIGNFLVEHVHLHEKAEELGVLKPWEVYAEEA